MKKPMIYLDIGIIFTVCPEHAKKYLLEAHAAFNEDGGYSMFIPHQEYLFVILPGLIGFLRFLRAQNIDIGFFNSGHAEYTPVLRQIETIAFGKALPIPIIVNSSGIDTNKNTILIHNNSTRILLFDAIRGLPQNTHCGSMHQYVMFHKNFEEMGIFDYTVHPYPILTQEITGALALQIERPTELFSDLFTETEKHLQKFGNSKKLIAHGVAQLRRFDSSVYVLREGMYASVNPLVLFSIRNKQESPSSTVVEAPTSPRLI